MRVGWFGNVTALFSCAQTVTELTTGAIDGVSAAIRLWPVTLSPHQELGAISQPPQIIIVADTLHHCTADDNARGPRPALTPTRRWRHFVGLY